MGRSLALSSSDELKSGGENLLVDPIPSLTIRGGYRYEWGDVLAPLAFIGQPTPPSGGFETARLNRNTALAGASYRWKQKLTTSADVEGAPGNHTYFLTSLYNYSYACVRVRYQALRALRLNLTFYRLTNSNLYPLVDYHLTSRQTSVGVTGCRMAANESASLPNTHGDNRFPRILCNTEHVFT